MFEKLTFKSRIIMGCSSLLVLMAIVSSIVFFNVKSLLDATKWVNHTHDVIAHTNLLAKCMVDMETGQRGFMLTGTDNFLEPFHGGLAKFNTAIKESKDLVSDNPAQVTRFAKVETLKNDWLTNAGEYEIQLKRDVDAGLVDEKSLKFVLEGKTLTGEEQPKEHRAGKDIMDNMRVLIDEIIAIEQLLMDERIKMNNKTASSAERTLLVGTLLAIVLGIIIISLLIKILMGQLGAEPSVLNKFAMECNP